MKHTHPSCLYFFVWMFMLCSVGTGRAEILGYTTEQIGSDTVLTGLVVKHDEGPVAYAPGRLIGCTITHFKSPHNRNIISPVREQVSNGPARCRLLGDLKLTTGIINPGGIPLAMSRDPRLVGPGADAGLAVKFDSPVVNLDGDDLVLFEIQRGDSPWAGDAFHVGPLVGAPGLHAITVRAFDVTFDHPSAKMLAPYRPYVFPNAVASLDQFQQMPLAPSDTPGGFKALAVGVDLSDMGFPPEAQVTDLFFQDAGSDGARVDPVLIAGLPEPTPPNTLTKLPELPKRDAGTVSAKCLDGPLSEVEEIIFAERVPGNDHWYANFGHYWCGQEEYPTQRLPDGWKPDPIFKPGGRLCRLNIRSGELSVLVDDPEGGVRDPQVHYDGGRIVFSYRPGRNHHYHLYEINIDGSGLVQLTDGACDDIEPTYLPNGEVMFCSSRCNRVVNCWRTPVATLYRCRADGSQIRVVSTNIEQDNTPWMLPDGRVLYMRWEYVDRNQLAFHHLWTTRIDGTAQMVFYGNQYPGTSLLNSNPTAVPGKHPGITMLDAKPIPGTTKIVASFSPSHGRPEHMGQVTIVDPTRGPDDMDATRRVSMPGKLYRDPYALSKDCFLVAGPEGISLMDGEGRTEIVYRGISAAGLQCHEPRPLRARPREPVLRGEEGAPGRTGRLVLSDIYRGRNMAGIAPGEIKKLLVLEQLPKPVNFSGGPWPLSVGGTFSLSRILGTVPVHPDGSAYFEAPALRSLFFVALDEDDLSVKRMQSFVSLQPDETTSCVGCHEQRTQSPHVQHELMALRDPPAQIAAIRGVPDVIDFPKHVQPILDRHCVECHNPERYEGRVDLSGDHTPLFSQSYWTIVQRCLITDGRNEPHGNRPPRSIGSSASRLMEFFRTSAATEAKSTGHYDVVVTDQERNTIRLWIETSATYPGTYAALGSGIATVQFPTAVMERKCGDCHGEEPKKKPHVGTGQYFRFGTRGPALPLVHTLADLKRLRGIVGYFKFGRDRTPQSLCNLTRPEMSLLLRAPLSTDAGGLQICKGPVFQRTDAADYRAILEAIRAAADQHRQMGRFDMPGFRPNDHYLIQMRRFGVLPPDLARSTPVDCYVTDRAYWELTLGR